jgi:phage I-like protein
MLDWAKGLDSVALSAYLDNAPQVVPLGKTNKDGLSEGGDSVSLSAEDQQVCEDCGISREEFLAQKKALKS